MLIRCQFGTDLQSFDGIGIDFYILVRFPWALKDQPAAGRGATWISENTCNTEPHMTQTLLYQSGSCVAVVDSHAFHGMSFVMIMANAVYIGIEAGPCLFISEQCSLFGK